MRRPPYNKRERKRASDQLHHLATRVASIRWAFEDPARREEIESLAGAIHRSARDIYPEQMADD